MTSNADRAQRVHRPAPSGRLLVQKFGGTSVGSVERIRAVADLIERFWRAGHQVLVVLSAMAGETDRLIALARQLTPSPDGREYDALVSSGEIISTALLAMELQRRSIPARSCQSWQIPIHTDDNHIRARIQRIDTEVLQSMLDAGQIPVVAGFQGISGDSVTTLGRGGSDTSAVALAARFGADECQIYTDVEGIFTADPSIVPEARKLSRIVFEEMLELASLGAQVLQIRAVEFAGKYAVPLRVLSSFNPGDGTLMTVDEEDGPLEASVISGIAVQENQSKITIRGVPDQPGLAAAILGPVGEQGIDVDMIVQNVGSSGTTDFTFTVARADLDVASRLMEKLSDHLGAAGVDQNAAIAKVSVVGVGMRSHAGVAHRMFEALASADINIQIIATSEIKISVVVAETQARLAVRTLHSVFELDKAVD